MGAYIDRKPFAAIDLNDPFFDSLKADYAEFAQWFHAKADKEAYVLRIDDNLAGFLHLKREDDSIEDIDPPLPSRPRIKIGTMKVDAHGTRLGERFVKKAFDHAVCEGADELYVTVFPKHTGLIELLTRFGFTQHGTKTTSNGTEIVFTKTIGQLRGDVWLDYPVVDSRAATKMLLSIYPMWHTKLFPDSILHNETYDVLSDVSHTNSIQKTYVCFMDLPRLTTGDIVVIYRTSDNKGPAEYRSVATSICTITEVRYKTTFSSVDDYVAFTEPFSVFSADELRQWWNRGRHLWVLKMLYNAALTKRLIRRDLADTVGLDRDAYWGHMNLTDDQFARIVKMGGVDGRLVAN
jgi:GNAT superfamily N-acetyltransferase